MTEIDFAFKKGDGATQDDTVNDQLAALAKSKGDLIRKLGTMRNERPEHVEAGIETVNAWADCAETLTTVRHDYARDSAKLAELEGVEGKEALREQLAGQCAGQMKVIEECAKREPKLRDEVAALFNPPTDEEQD